MQLSELPIRPVDHLPALGAADDQAIAGKAGALSYAELSQAVGRLAGWLAGLGLAPGARVASWVAKGQVACLMPLAAARAGMIHVPVNPLLKRAQVAHILADSGAALMVGTGSRLASLEAGDVPAACRTVAEDAVLPAAEGYAPLPPSTAQPDDLAAILYTSGSTGKPKGVMLSHANLWLGAVSVAEYLRLTPQDKVLAVLPFSFDYGQNQLFSTWAAGATVVPLDYLTARDVVKAVEREGITTLAGVPPLWVQLTEAEWPPETAARMKRITNSGGALTKALIGRLRATFPNADIYPMYGLTEAFRSTYLPPELVASHPESMGRAIPHAEILVCHPDGSLTADDEPGELVHCGPLVAQGYWNDPIRTAERFRPAPPSSSYDGLAVWSGDTVRRDSAGLLYFVARADAMIKSAGNRISPTEIEEAAQSVAGVSEAVALGVPDVRLGQAVLLLVRVSGDAPAVIDALRDTLRKELPNFMMPSDIRAVEHFPRNPNGKIDRVEIAHHWRALTEGQTA
ncbi:MAG: acyl-CoA ligase (AMP-forming), exosortase A system-associated [Sphingobium sp.]|nr:acyl-CoA ligase (AMP-forming), exosortase A system-associated [Sphingobium sp.]MCI1272376.1 acyl-CoA ligase (AMP-forming), exosortase A system-associated [Sphingobium sp.]MCI1755014.1 acyl-CoA ligase (AMP-forming), exosortase A system-associated [Sphingobium sp.]MCI2051763.1 acyl-CoA ligase (AMP-forming), exosortase A system-associated [Sphingobium sp.]